MTPSDKPTEPGGVVERLAELVGLNRSRAAYWRKAYEDLVDQTGRDLNDGLGIDPRRKDWPAKSGRAHPSDGESK